MEFVCARAYACLSITVISGKLHENKEQPQDPRQKNKITLNIY